MAKGKSKGKKKGKSQDKALDKAAKTELEEERWFKVDLSAPSLEAPEQEIEPPEEPNADFELASGARASQFKLPDEDTLYDLANLFKIFADPTRLRILYSLIDGPRCVADISEFAGVTQGATSHQLRSMKQERLVKFVRKGKQVFYSIADDRVQVMLAQGLSYIED